jgi:hypothetical protein
MIMAGNLITNMSTTCSPCCQHAGYQSDTTNIMKNGHNEHGKCNFYKT